MEALLERFGAMEMKFEAVGTMRTHLEEIDAKLSKHAEAME